MGDKYSSTVQRGGKWVNILASDPPTAEEEANAPAMQEKPYDSAEEADKAAADEAQADYDKQRADPSSSWYTGPKTPNLPPETEGNWNAEQDPPGKPMDFYKGCKG